MVQAVGKVCCFDFSLLEKMIYTFISDTVPNPCLTTTTIPEPYHPFEFSAQAFIQCNGDFLYVQPCAPGLIWNKNEQVCDR
ncbi:unnamed protein product, partial [Rotaria socialis]